MKLPPNEFTALTLKGRGPRRRGPKNGGPPFLPCGMTVQDLAKLPLCLKRLSALCRSHTGHTHFDKMYSFLQTRSINRVVARFTK